MLYYWPLFKIYSAFLSCGHSSERHGCGHWPRTWEIQGKSEASKNVMAFFRPLHWWGTVSRTGCFVCYVIFPNIFKNIFYLSVTVKKKREFSLLIWLFEKRIFKTLNCVPQSGLHMILRLSGDFGGQQYFSIIWILNIRTIAKSFIFFAFM